MTEDGMIEIEIQKEGNQVNSPDEQPAEKQPVAEGSATGNYYEQLLRTQAELINYKRRTEERLQEWRAQAGRDVLSRLLPIIDDFDIFFTHHGEECPGVIGGMHMIYTKLMTTLKELGLTVISPEGEMFDPAVHEAVMTEEHEHAEEGRILRVWQKGFYYNDVLLRPARVITAGAGNRGEADDKELL